MVAVDAPGAAEPAAVSAGTGLEALLKGSTAGSRPSADDATVACCPWCGMESAPGPFCSDCGSSLLTAV
jgi:hypothetical protein